MKYFANLFWSFLCVSSVSYAEGTNTLDLEKFEAEAISRIQSQFGPDAMVPGSERILFQDGAAATDSPPIYDLASINYVVGMKPGVLPQEDLRVAYRLNLNGEDADFTFVHVTDDERPLIFLSARGGTIVYKEGATQQERMNLIREIQSLAPEAQISDLEITGLIIYEVKPAEAARVARVVAASTIVEAVELQLEQYRMPFEFDSPVPLSNQGKKCVDSLRTLTRSYKEKGVSFSSETFVPERLR